MSVCGVVSDRWEAIFFLLRPTFLRWYGSEDEVEVMKSRRHQEAVRRLLSSAALASLCLLISSCAQMGTGKTVTRPIPPSELYPGFFEAVAEAQIYEPKDWADAVPREKPETILAAWSAAGQPRSEEALRAFTERHFDLPSEVASDVQLPPNRTLREHIEALWPILTRDDQRTPEPFSSLISLPEPYIVPGGRFREVYYWDAYFTMTGLGDQYAEVKRDMVDNFASQIERFGHIPNGNRSYYLSRSQPPFFFAMVGLLDETDPAKAWAEYLPALRQEHAFWMRGEDSLEPGSAGLRVVRLKDGSLLNRYWDGRDVPRDESYIYDVETAENADRPKAELYRDLRAAAESGWDFSSRWTDCDELSCTVTTDIVPVDLNAILYGLERAIEAGCTESGDNACATEFRERRTARGEAILAKLWSEDQGAFLDLDRKIEALRTPVTAATIYPLFFGVANEAYGERVAETVRTELLAPGGLVTTTRTTGEQWDAPNGWAPLHWLATIGFDQVGEGMLSDQISERWLTTVARSFCESGKLVEKYDVVNEREGGGGEYPTQDGFGWTNGVTSALLERREDLSVLSNIRPITEEPEACASTVDQLISQRNTDR